MVAEHPCDKPCYIIASRKMSDCCFMVHHKIRARSEGRGKRQREQASDVGMEVANSHDQNLTNGGGDENMEFESYQNQASDGDRSSEESRKERYENRNSPKQVTDDSCESEDTEKGKPSNEGCSLQANGKVRKPQHQHVQGGRGNGQQQVHETGNETNNCEKEAGMKRTGPVMEDEQQSSASSLRSPTLPQHERIQHVEPLDINYRSTPACLKLREMLISRLSLIAPTGRIQVVSAFNAAIASHFHHISLPPRFARCLHAFV